MQASFGSQTKALIQKSYTYQKRNIGTNICLCVAPIFFCLIMVMIQVLINRILSGDDYKCGCFCEQCCPSWALKSQLNNFTSNGQGTITVNNVAAFGGLAAIQRFSNVTSNSDGTYTINTCAPSANGPCPTGVGYSCVKLDTTKCGVQFSSASQLQWCAVPVPSAFPAVTQVPESKARAKPWGNTAVPGVGTISRTATLVTGSNTTLVVSLSTQLFPGAISTDPGLWNRVLTGLYGGSASDPNQGNVFYGDLLSSVGLQFGTTEKPSNNLYYEAPFQIGRDLQVLLSVGECIKKGLSTSSSSSTCLASFLRQYFANDSSVPQSLLEQLPPCKPIWELGSNPDRLLSALNLFVSCTENAVETRGNTDTIEDELYCGYYQARCNMNSLVNNKYLGAVDLKDSARSKLNLDFYWNETEEVVNRGFGGGGPSNVLRLSGSLSSAVTAWWRSVTGENSAPMQLLGVMSMPKVATKLDLDLSSLLGPLLYCWVVQLLFPTFLQQLVYEKEKRLRMMIKMHGLKDSVYWLVTYLWYLMLYCIYILIFMVFGALVRLRIFTKTNLGIQLIFYFLHGNCMIAFAFLLSSLFSSSRTAVVVAFLYVFASGLIGSLLLQDFMELNKRWVFFVEWIPAFSLYRGLFEMASYTFIAVYKNEPGLQFKQLGDEGNGMLATWGIFFVEWALFIIVGLYLEQVISSGTGIRRRPLFFIEWMWRKSEQEQLRNAEDDGGARSSLNNKVAALRQSVSMGNLVPGANDVQIEKERVEKLGSYEDNPIVLKDIKKVYPALDGGKPKVAVRSMTLGVQRGECFGLLGPNGAGKSTTINMMVGFLEPTAGTGIVEGFDIRNQMSSIYNQMGVCPQHDLLWEQLTAREHLRFYGRLKGLEGATLNEAIDAALKGVNLYNVGDKLAGKYSGGMKRRLSVAISFMGSPKVVYLDEPSTGLDPASRRSLWDVVEGNKEGRSIILTTHSMEEAEQLCDRLGIFVDGQLVCIGNPKEITSRYAGFYVFTITVPASQEPSARQLVASMSPGAVLTYALGGTLKYELPSNEVTLSSVFEQVNAAKAHGLEVVDWGVANATLEEAFIKLARGIGAKMGE